MNQLDEQTRVWWTEKGFIVAMAVVLFSTTLLSPSTSVAYSNDNVVTVKAGERYSLETRPVVEYERTLEYYRNKETLTQAELKELLKLVGFTGKSLKTAWAVVMKESRGNPRAHNGNRSTGDNSYGLFQINMIDGLGVTRRDKFELDSNEDLFDPVTNAEIAFYMTNRGEDWSSWKVDANQPDGGNSAYAKWLDNYSDN